MPASVQRDSFWELHYHRRTLVQVYVKIPAELLGQMGFKLLGSFAESGVDAWSTGKLEKILKRKLKKKFKKKRKTHTTDM